MFAVHNFFSKCTVVSPSLQAELETKRTEDNLTKTRARSSAGNLELDAMLSGV